MPGARRPGARAAGLVLLLLVLACLADGAAAALQSPRHAVVLSAPTVERTPPPPGAGWQPVTLPDDAGYSRPALARAPAWYRIGLDYPDDPARQLQWAVYVPYFYDGGEIWLNGSLIGSVAERSATVHARTYRPQTALLPASLLRPGYNELAIRAMPSLDYPLRFPQVSVGPQDEIQPLHNRRLFWVRTVPELTVLVSLLVAGFVAFIWWRRPDESLYGLFGLAAVLWAVRTMTFLIDTLPVGLWQWWRVLYQCATGGFVIVMAVFTLHYAGMRRPWLDRALVAYGLVGPLWFALGGFGAEQAIARWWLGGMVGVGLLIIAVAFVYARRRGTLTAAALSAVMAFAVLVGIHDYLLTWDPRLLGRFFPEWTGHRIHLLHYGSNTLLLAMGALLTARFLRTLHSLEELNRTLETRVADRERALAENYARVAALEREHAAAEERQLIMRDLHDGLGSQLFTSLSRVERGDMDEAQIAGALRACIADMRLALDALASGEHDLGAALGNFMFRWEGQLLAAGVRSGWDIDMPEDGRTLSPHAALQLLRVAQEALTNVLKHAGATRVQVRLRRAGEMLEMEIEDNGRGLDPEPGRQGGRGLHNMRSRAERLGGSLELRSVVAGGCCVVLRLPMTVPAAAAA
ncbi:sensor histidine kinase [Variovorax sp. RA8]|uniref:sensor histidine kinase n=1 Tax=Variovorax sp. (strain JCM 16519 / RA8) TaxID=662548 RepID=UPI001319400F|nr:ATP-binding protein [Variovorax sp. RA8]VTU36981.1 Sensor protein VraS [Variovorax sp. RA8]